MGVCVGCGVETSGSTSNIPCCFPCYEAGNPKLMAALLEAGSAKEASHGH